MKSFRRDYHLLEEWRPIPRYSGYEASSLGRVRSVDRVVVDRNGRRIRRKGQVLRPYFDERTSPYGCFAAGDKTCKVHVAVTLAFHGEPPEGKPYACHGDGDTMNNVPSNLRWGSAQENQLDRHNHATTTQGEAHPHAKLTEDNIIDIIGRLATGESQRSIGAAFGVSQSQISNIKTGARWAHVQHCQRKAA
nr:HNH endonuclease signature motif containing protein [Sphingomonas sp. ACRSK]